MAVRSSRFRLLAVMWAGLGVVGTLSIGLPASQLRASDPNHNAVYSHPAVSAEFIRSHCLDCHQGSGAEAGFDVSELIEPRATGESQRESMDVDREEVHSRWISVVDRVESGEMPPVDASTARDEERRLFIADTSQWLTEIEQDEASKWGRVRGRRLTNLQLERSLHDLFGIDLPLAKHFPQEPKTGGFTTVADGQPMSHFQLEQHLAAIDRALDEAMRRAMDPPDEYDQHFTARELARTRPQSRTREPELREGLAVTWRGGTTYYGRLPATTAPEDGWYRFTFTASAVQPPESGGVWCTVRSGVLVSSAPLMDSVGVFEATSEPRQWTFETWLPMGHRLEIRPADAHLKSGKFAGGQVGTGEGEGQGLSGVALHEMQMQRIHLGPDNPSIRRLLFGEFEIVDRFDSTESDARLRRGQSAGVKSGGSAMDRAELLGLATDNPREAAQQLLVRFADRAFRRPVDAEEIAPYIASVQTQIDQGAPVVKAILGGYRSLLCSPRFLYHQENVGELEDEAIASRLSYFFWNAPPDTTLRDLAKQGKLRDRDVLRQQVERMLDDRRGGLFMSDFATQWLDLDQIDFTQPDSKRYRDFDNILQQSMLAETLTYLQDMLDQNISVGGLVDSDYTFLNERLARHYGIDGVTGDAMQRVGLKAGHRRGGLLTQGAILKITANGTDTSPVVRGVWVAERLLGIHIPPPPQNVPAIEPDIRGSTTIRQMLEKHRSNDACASCHTKIDPIGFALENYDPTGAWRDHYPTATRDSNRGALSIDPSYQMPDGAPFDDIDEFRALVLRDVRAIAKCVAEKMVVYGTGAPVRFADRQAIERIVDQTESDRYGFRSLVHAVVSSPLFLEK